MALLFHFIGLGVKREFIVGEMSSWPARVLPDMAALGGIVVPATIYVSINALLPGHLDG